MKALLLLVLISGPCFSQVSTPSQPRPTLDQALTKEQIQSILKNVVAKALPDVKDNFRVTDESLAEMRSGGIPVTFATKLETLRGREIMGRENLAIALNESVGENEAGKYQGSVAFYTHSIVVVTDDFYERIQKLVLKASPPDKADAKKWLEVGFQQFITDYTDFLRKTSPDKSTVVIGFKLAAFLAVAASNCGKLPCDVPPCCGKSENYCADPCMNP